MARVAGGARRASTGSVIVRGGHRILVRAATTSNLVALALS
jgi:hypothetical protein